jgi:hypothetical protein
MPVYLPPTRAQSPSLEALVDEIVSHGEESLLEQDIARWREDLQKRLEQIQQHPEQGLGFIEEHVRQATLQLQRLLVQKAMQDKANQVDEKCPDCEGPLHHKKRRVARWVDAYCGKVKLLRTHGWCPHCRQWVFPADRVLGLRDDSTASPLVQEMCALLVSKMPAEQAEALSLRVTGRSWSRSTLAREAQRQGESALSLRQRLVEAPVFVAPASKTKAALSVEQPAQPFTLVIRTRPLGPNSKNATAPTEGRTLALGLHGDLLPAQPPLHPGARQNQTPRRYHRAQLRGHPRRDRTLDATALL